MSPPKKTKVRELTDPVTSLSRAGFSQHYKTNFGSAFLGDSLQLLRSVPATSISLVVTSPPFALRKKKDYGNEDADKYVEWFLPFADEVQRVLKEDGSFVIELGGAWNPKSPTRAIYQYELLVALIKKTGFFLAQDFFWYNNAKMPSPAQWVTIERVRVTDAVNTIWWLSKTERPKASNKRVLNEYSESMKRLFKKGYNSGLRPSGHVVSEKWNLDNGGSIPKNLLLISNTSSNDKYQRLCREAGVPLHPARFPKRLPEFFIKFLTESTDTVLDIFAGSNVTGEVCESLGRKWLAFEKRLDYLEGSKYRFDLPVDTELAKPFVTSKTQGGNGKRKG